MMRSPLSSRGVTSSITASVIFSGRHEQHYRAWLLQAIYKFLEVAKSFYHAFAWRLGELFYFLLVFVISCNRKSMIRHV